jgi:hypothetical protein
MRAFGKLRRKKRKRSPIRMDQVVLTERHLAVRRG